MLARVTSGQSGVVEYLKNGVKSDRELSRDELDHRVTIDGNIAITDVLIKDMDQAGRKENYLHITLSFGERDLAEKTIIEAYRDYKSAVMSAYSDDEFNVYAEIHYPKIKSYKDKKTGDLIERFPHVHMVIPQKNLVSEKALNPFGLYSSNIKYHDAIQETVNRKHKLESPYDNQRKYRISDNSEFISRYKGDSFKGSNSAFKNEIFDLITSKNIRSMDTFKKELSKYGEVTTGKAGAIDEYLQIKVAGNSKNIRLKENAFKPLFIESRELVREKPTDKEINKNINEWVDTRSHEMKHIHAASPKTRNEYHALKKEQQQEFLHDRRDDFARRYGRTSGVGGADNIQPSGRTTNRKPGLARDGGRVFTQVTNGLPNMSERSLVGTSSRQFSASKGVLPSNEHDNLEQRGASRDNQLRRSIDRSRRGGGGRLNNDNLPEQFLTEHKVKSSNETLQQFKEIRKKLDPNRVLTHFEKTHGLIKDNYQLVKAKDGTPRIKVGNRAFNVSDFCTQHMRQSWQDTQKILSTEYEKQLKIENKKIDLSVVGLNRFDQLKKGLPKQNVIFDKQKRLEARKEKRVLNSIIFVSSRVTQGNGKQTIASQLNHSVQILKHLQQQERYGVNTMDLKLKKDQPENVISSAHIDLKTATDNFKKQQEVIRQLSTKMGDLVPSKDLKNGRVEFSDKNTGNAVFQDVGTHIVMSDKKPSIDHVAVAMTFAAEKFGKVEINGTKEFKQQVIAVAVAKDLTVVFADKKMQEQFIKDKESLKASQTDKEVDSKENTIKNSNLSTNKPDEKPVTAIKDGNSSTNKLDEKPVTLVNHGEAPHKNIKDNALSYFVETSDGKTQWGVGLKEAVKNSNAEIGDEIKIKRVGSEDVKVNVDVKNEQGEVVSTESKDVIRNTWEVEALKKDNANVNSKEILDQHKKESNISNGVGMHKIPPEALELKSLKVTYHWSEKDKAMEVKVNGKSPKEIPTEVMTNIKNNDKFLNSFSIDEIKKGGLDLSKSNAQPVPKTFNAQGVPVQDMQSNAAKQTQ